MPSPFLHTLTVICVCFRTWKLMSRSVIRKLLKVSLETDGASGVQFAQVNFYSDGGRALCVNNDGDVYVTDVRSYKLEKIYSLSAKCTALITIEDEGKTPCCVFGLETGATIKFDIESKVEVGNHRGFEQEIEYFSKHPWSDRLLATLSNTAIIWDISKASPLPLQRFRTFENLQLKRAVFGPNGDNIFTCFVDGSIFMWDFPSLNYLNQLQTGPSSTLQCLTTSEYLKMMLTVNENAEFSLWNLTDVSDRQVFTVPELKEAVVQVEITVLVNARRDVKIPTVVALTTNGELFFVDLQNHQLIYKHPETRGENLIKFAVSSYSAALRRHPFASIFDDGSVELWDIRNLYRKSRTYVETQPKPFVTSTEIDRKSEVLIKPKRQDKTEKLPKITIDISELRKTLETFGEFPSKYRAVIWRHLLRLPLNKQAFATLLNRGIHPAYANLEQRFPISDEALLNSLKKVLSALAHWCPLFAEVVFLPLMIFPFVRVLDQHLLVCFEVIMTYLVNWCEDWFGIYPAPPFHSLAKVESLLEKHGPGVLSHLTKCDVPMRVYAWPLLESSFSDVFTADEWCRVWDHIFASQKIDFLYAVVAAYSIVSQNSLLRCQKPADFQRYFHEKNPVPLDEVLEKAKTMLTTVAGGDKRAFSQLTELTYPLFTNFPIAVIENHAQHMRKIREMEANYVKQKKEAALLEAEFGQLHEMEAEWRRKEAMLVAMEDLRQREVVLEERRLLEQRSRLQMQTLALLEKQMKMLENKKRGLQREYLLRRKDDIVRMSDNARWMATLRGTELEDARHEADVHNYQLQMDKCLYEIKLLEDEIASKAKFGVQQQVGATENNIRSSENSSEQSSSLSSVISRDENLDEKLRQLEASNKEMEKEIENLIQKLENIS